MALRRGMGGMHSSGKATGRRHGGPFPAPFSLSCAPSGRRHPRPRSTRRWQPRFWPCEGSHRVGRRPAVAHGKAAGADNFGEGRVAGRPLSLAGGLLGLDCRKGCRLAPGVGFEKARAAGRVVSSRRKTSRAVITRTIIDGTTDMRGIPRSDCVFYGKLATGLTGKGDFSGLSRTRRPIASRSAATQRSLPRKRCSARHFVKASTEISPGI